MYLNFHCRKLDQTLSASEICLSRDYFLATRSGFEIIYSSNFNCMNAIYHIEQISGESNELLKKTYVLYRS